MNNKLAPIDSSEAVATGESAQPANAVTVLLVSPCEEDQIELRHIFSHSNWRLRSVRTRGKGLELVRRDAIGVVICERDLPDGSWKDVLDEAATLPRPPLVIVASRLADGLLWAEVLNLGGYDVLLKPFDQKEVVWSVSLAWRHWSAHLNGPQRALAPASRRLGAA